MSADYYESPLLLDQYLLFHYGSAADILPAGMSPPPGAENFPARCAQLLLDSAGAAPQRAIDLGCAVGRATFELARRVPAVLGVDLSRNFITAADRLQRDGALTCTRLDEGELSTPVRVAVPPAIDRSRVRFLVGDAGQLPADLGVFDLVLLANLVDRLADPAGCLGALAPFVAPGGTVLIASPYTWLETFTPRARWLGGRPADAPRPTRERIGEALGGGFSFLARADLPFVIREHARKFQWSVAEATLWRRA